MLHAEDLKIKNSTPPETRHPLHHSCSLWMLIGLITWELVWRIHQIASPISSWQEAILIAVPAASVLFLSRRLKTAVKWPLSNRKVYIEAALVPLAFSLIVGFFLNFFSSADATPLPYLPFLNPIDLAMATVVIAYIAWKRIMDQESGGNKARQTPDQMATQQFSYFIDGLWCFTWATFTLLRVIHHTLMIEWDADAMMGSAFVQSALSIFWTILALAMMVIADKTGKRWQWKTGAALVGVVVVKLFLIDLSSQGTLARISAFLGVGVLLLLVGYLAPIPPEKIESSSSKEKSDLPPQP